MCDTDYTINNKNTHHDEADGDDDCIMGKYHKKNIESMIEFAQMMKRTYDHVVIRNPTTNTDHDQVTNTNDHNFPHLYQLEGLMTRPNHIISTNVDDDGNRGEQQQQQEIVVLQQWAEFCASIFSYKANPPPSAYFLRHYHADPYHIDPSLIRIARYCSDHNNHNGTTSDNDHHYQNNPIVASCRLFIKKLSTGYVSSSSSSYVIAGGIGEVCTDYQHRQRGLSKHLLHDCITIMNHHSHFFQVSILHCSAIFFPVYQASGYVNWINTMHSWIDMNTQELVSLFSSGFSDPNNITESSSVTSSTTNRRSIRLAKFPQDTYQLYHIHQQYSEIRFIGCIIRSMEYWNSYISQELDGTLYVVVEQSDIEEEKEIILGWLSIRQRSDENTIYRYQVRDYGCYRTNTTSIIFLQLLHHFIQMNQLHDVTDIIQLQLPKPIYDEINLNYPHDDYGENKIFINEVIEIDQGWMYKPIINHHNHTVKESNHNDESSSGNKQDEVSNNDSVSYLHHLFNTNLPHVIWSADSF